MDLTKSVSDSTSCGSLCVVRFLSTPAKNIHQISVESSGLQRCSMSKICKYESNVHNGTLQAVTF